MNCPVCIDGNLEDNVVEKWMRRGARWILFRNVPALVCDLCGETTFSAEITERLVSISQPDSREVPTGFVNALEFDLRGMDAAVASGARLIAADGTIDESPFRATNQGADVYAYDGITTSPELVSA